ncbi:hypothetical protein ACHHYP_00351, partial [Achlya hypogyna]
SYVGDIYDRLRHGHGTYTFPGGYFKYTGSWERGKMHGHGIFFLGDGSTYEGSFVAGEMDGSGLRRWPDGSTYTGDFLKGELHGQGCYVSASGKRYDGAWRDNQYCGQGELWNADGSHYKGDFEAHKYHGEGLKTFPDGSTYDGFWSLGLQDGLGTYTSLTGLRYEGNWRNGKRCGKGRGEFDLGIVYDGFWVNDAPENRPCSLTISRLSADYSSVDPTPLVFRDEPAKPVDPAPPGDDAVAEPPLPPEPKRLPAFRIDCLNRPPLSKTNNQQGICVSEESGRLLILRLLQGKVPGSHEPEAAPEVPKGKKTAAVAAPELVADVPPTPIPLMALSEDKAYVEDFCVTTENGTALVPAIFALPLTVVPGDYFLLVESAFDTSLPPAYYPLMVAKAEDPTEKVLGKAASKKK